MLPLLIATAGATTYERAPSLLETAERSRSVVRGVVLDAVSEPSPGGLVTTYTIDVERTLAGAPLDELVVRLPGGRTDAGFRQVFSGVPLWEVGDEVVVFVGRDGRTPLSGVFEVRDGELLDPLGRFGADPVPMSAIEDLTGASTRPTLPRR